MKEDQILYMLTSLPGNWYPLKLTKWLKLKTIRFNGQDVGGYHTHYKNMVYHKITPKRKVENLSNSMVEFANLDTKVKKFKVNCPLAKKKG